MTLAIIGKNLRRTPKQTGLAPEGLNSFGWRGGWKKAPFNKSTGGGFHRLQSLRWPPVNLHWYLPPSLLPPPLLETWSQWKRLSKQYLLGILRRYSGGEDYWDFQEKEQHSKAKEAGKNWPTGIIESYLVGKKKKGRKWRHQAKELKKGHSWCHSWYTKGLTFFKSCEEPLVNFNVNYMKRPKK